MNHVNKLFVNTIKDILKKSGIFADPSILDILEYSPKDTKPFYDRKLSVY